MTDYFDGLSEAKDLVDDEVVRQLTKWGIQHHPDGTSDNYQALLRVARTQQETQRAAELNLVTWKQILEEEVAEAFAEIEQEKLIAELSQVAAVCVNWIADIKSNGQ